MHEAPELLYSTTVFTGAVFDVVEERIRLATGHIRRFALIRHPGAAVILPRQDDGTLFVIQQYRHALRKTLLEFPAGTLESGETPLACAQREIAEEIGYAARQWEDLGQLYPAPGFCNEVQYCFFATDLTPCVAQADEDELIEVVSMSSTQIAQAIQTGEMMDGKSIALYTRAHLRGLV